MSSQARARREIANVAALRRKSEPAARWSSPGKRLACDVLAPG